MTKAVVCLGTVLLTVLAFCSGVSASEAQQDTAAVTSATSPTVTFDFDRTGLPVPRFTIVLHEDGSGTYRAEEAERRSADSALQQVSVKKVDRPISVTAETTAMIFKTARALNRFNLFCGTKAKNIADTGKKTLSYSGADGNGACTYNYSDEKSVTMLTDTFYGIAYTMDVGRRLDFERRFDRLGLDAEMLSLEHAIEAKNALELGNIAGTLRKLADDEELMQRVRMKAAKMLERSAAPSAP